MNTIKEKILIVLGMIGILIGIAVFPWPKKPTAMWGDDWIKTQPPPVAGKIDKFSFILIGGSRGPKYELGLRSDGVVVWREVKP